MINLTQIWKYVGENSNFIIIFFVVVVLVIVIVGDFSLKMWAYSTPHDGRPKDFWTL